MRVAKNGARSLFLIALAAAIFSAYASFFKPGKSLFLAYFYDPCPRLQWYPSLIESSRQIHSRHFPLWCSLEGAGMPLLANSGTAPLHPFNLIFEFFPYLRLLDYILLIRLFLLGVFTYLFAIELGLSPLAAAGSALTICFSGYIARNINYILLNNDIWLPAALLIAERMVKNRVILSQFLLLILITAMELIGGSPQSAFYFFMLLFLYVLIRGRRPEREIPALVLALGLGFFLVSIQLISFVEYWGYAWSSHDPGIHSADRIPLRSLFSLFFPWIFGNAHADPQMRISSGYIGLIPVFLGLTTVFRIKRMPTSALFFWIVLLVLAGIIFYLPPFAGLNYLPVINRFRNARSAYFGLSFSIAMLAGFGLDNFIKNRLPLRDCLMALALTSALAVLAMALALLFPVNASLRIAHRGPWLLPALIFMIAAAVCLAGAKFQKKKFAGFMVVALGLVNLLYLARGLEPVADIQPGIWRFKNPVSPPIMEPIIADRTRNRFLGINNVFSNNINILFGINDLRAFEALRPKSYVQAIAEIEGFRMEQAAARFVKDGWDFQISETSVNHPLLERLGVKYLLSDREVSGPRWELISRTRDYFLYLNKNAWPRVWVKESSGRYDFEKSSVGSYGPDQVVVRVNADGSQLILADQYTPGWRALALPSGRELKISKEDLLFRKVPVTKSDNFIKFVYQPRGFEIGLFASLTAFFCLLLLSAIAAFKTKI